jgi:glycerate-2-kinase
MDPSPPWVASPNARAADEALLRAAYRAAATGADAYRAVREAVRLEGDTLRLGNRFVPVGRFREVAFLAAGNAASSLALGVTQALGDRLTQGFVAGPDPLPPEVPFRSARVPLGWAGSKAGREACDAAVELAQGLGASDLLLVLLSPGALGALATAPTPFADGEWARRLADLHEDGASSPELELLVRVTGGGAVGGRLAAITPGTTVVTLVVERGEGAVLVGGGPTIPVRAEERQRARQLLERLGSRSSDVYGQIDGPPNPPSVAPATVSRPVVIVSPADALREIGAAFAERKWRTTLAEPFLAEAPEPAADRFLARVDELARDGLTRAAATQRKGVAFFAAGTLDVPEGLDERAAMARFVDRASRNSRRRDLVVGALRTAGATGWEPVATREALRPGTSPRGPGPDPSPVAHTGITDVGVLLVGLLPLATA